MREKSKSGAQAVSKAQEIPAGDFSAWLARIRKALLDDSGADVACGECKACCDSSYFIHIRPEETRTLGRIDPRILFAAPGMREGHVLMGCDKHGTCPMLVDGGCSIYPDRPITCRNFDCRIFAAAGVEVDGKKEKRIRERVDRWKFSYPSRRDAQERSALLATARFIRENADRFPGKAIPTVPSQLAILAIKTYRALLADAHDGKGEDSPDPRKVAARIVDAAKEFDARIEGS